MKKAIMVLEDGTIIPGSGFGAAGEVYPEVVFNTAMTGEYGESLTDSSCAGQILVSPNPLVGNYGVCREDYMSDCIKAKGSVVKELCWTPGSWRYRMNPDECMIKHAVSGTGGVDTRKLTRNIGEQATRKYFDVKAQQEYGVN